MLKKVYFLFIFIFLVIPISYGDIFIDLQTKTSNYTWGSVGEFGAITNIGNESTNGISSFGVLPSFDSDEIKYTSKIAYYHYTPYPNYVLEAPNYAGYCINYIYNSVEYNFSGICRYGIDTDVGSQAFNSTFDILLNETIYVQSPKITFSVGLDLPNNNFKYVDLIFDDELKESKRVFPPSAQPNEFNFTYNGFVDRIRFTYEVGTSDLQVIMTNITIVNATSQSNTIPIANYTVNSNTSLCIDEDGDSIQVNYSISAFDEEGDTIYYATSLNNQNETDNIKFYEYCDYYNGQGNCKKCNDLSVYCSGVPNYDFLDSVVYPNSNTCLVDDTINYNTSKHNLVSVIPFGEVYASTGFGFNPFCDGTDKSLYLSLANPLKDIYFTTYFYSLSLNDEFNLTLYDSFLDPTVKLGFKMTQDNFLVTNYGESISNLFVNVSKSQLRNNRSFGIVFSNFVDNDAFEMNIIYNNSVVLYKNESLFNNDNLNKYFSVSIGNETSIIMDSLEYGGIFTLPSFSTTPRLNETVNSIGVHSNTLFVTDNVHLTTGYNTYNLDYTVYDCALVVDKGGVPQEYQNVGKALKGSITKLCSSLDGVTFGTQSLDFSLCILVQSFGFILSLIVAIVSVVIFRFIAPLFELPVGLIVFAVMEGIINIFIIDIGLNMAIISGILFTIGALLLVIRTIGGGSTSLS